MLLLLFFYFALRTQIYPGICVWLSKLPNVNVWRTFFLAASLSPKFPRKSKIPPSNLRYFVPGNAYGIARQPLALLYNIVRYIERKSAIEGTTKKQ